MSAFIPTGGNRILVDTPEDQELNERAAMRMRPAAELVGWLVPKADQWEAHRNRGFGKRWRQYWRLYRGMWDIEEKNRESERSRLIAPALSQAIEMTVAEIEEGLFSKDTWFDIVDDIEDQDRMDATQARDRLLEDLDKVNAKDNFSEAVLNAAIFGTGIIKISVNVVEEATLSNDGREVTSQMEERVVVSVESLRPDEFIPDPSGKTIQEMLGCFHKVKKPLHSVLESIASGKYRQDALAQLMPHPVSTGINEIDPTDPQALITNGESQTVEILEYHGKVPAKFLQRLQAQERPTTVDELLNIPTPSMEGGDGPLVEAIVTIANRGVLLRAMANPFVMKDRSIMAFQFEKVPGRFWGRGVAEKGFNPQKALDAELRARIDALGFISSPMIGVDNSRLQKGFKLGVKPGKIWFTNGNPNDILSPLKVGDITAGTFNQASEMERLVQMGTGAFDTATQLKTNSDGSASNTSLLMGAFVKRAKRAIRNVNDNLLSPAIKKIMWRYVEYAPTRYPQDMKFQVKPTLGIVARELEATQQSQMIAMLGAEQFPRTALTVARGIVELSSSPIKAEIKQAMEQDLAPPSEEEQALQQELQRMQLVAARADAQRGLLENQKTIAETRKLLNEALVAARKADVEEEKVRQEQQRILIQLGELEQQEESNRLDQQRLELEGRRLEIQARQVNNSE